LLSASPVPADAAYGALMMKTIHHIYVGMTVHRGNSGSTRALRICQASDGAGVGHCAEVVAKIAWTWLSHWSYYLVL
jgi:hypothetical protein